MENVGIGVGDTPSHIMRELPGFVQVLYHRRYTLTYNEGTSSVYAAFSRLKHLVVQIAQMSFWSLISISNMPEIVTIGAIFLVFLASFFICHN